MIKANKNKWFIKGFRRYVRRYLSKHFFRFYYSSEFDELNLVEPLPVICILNHSTWWDVLTAYYIANEVFPFNNYAVMDEPQLKRYRFFTRAGFYSVDRESKIKGIKDFLSYSDQILQQPNTAVWLCPQGDLVSNDLRPIRFFPGTAHLIKHLKRCWVLPIALDYEFCQEPQPEAFALAGKPIKFELNSSSSIDKLNLDLELALTRLMDSLKEKTKGRDFSQFQTLIEGKKGIHKFYDFLTQIRYFIQGKPFHSTHGEYKKR